MRDAVRTLRLMIAISLRADRVRSLGALITATGQQAFLPFQAIGLMILVDGAIARDSTRAYRGAAVVVVVLATSRLSAHASLNIRMRLRENTQLYLDTHLMELTAGVPGIEHHERPEYLDQVELIRSERNYLANPFNPISWTLANTLQALSTVAVLGGVHPSLALLPLLGVPAALAGGIGSHRLVRLTDAQAEPNRVLRHFYELTTKPEHAKEVRVFGIADELLRRRRALFDELEGERQQLAMRHVLLSTAARALFAVGYLAGIVWAVTAARRGDASTGDVVLLVAIGAQLDRQLSELGEYVAWFIRTHRAVRRLQWFTDYADRSHASLVPQHPAAVPDRLRTGITVEQVAFAYPGTETPVLRDVSLHFPAGSTVAIVGENGAGKTTLVKLLLRLYEPTSGRILIDGSELGDLPIDEWRARVSAGFQDFAQFQLIARETVGVGDPSAPDDDETILAALRRGASHDVVDALPTGLSTQLGREFDGGVEVSLGQWQKLALGRAMMRRSPLLLVLDETTASLDATTEHRLFERFHGAAREAARESGAITMLISHRFSTVRMADLIVVVADGTVAEAGSHEELIRRGGLYAELYDLQASAYR